MKELKTMFTDLGGTFVTPIEELTKKLNKTKAFFFDWEGVFNIGFKGKGVDSGFHKSDTYGLDLLRFSFWLKNQRQFPHYSILSQTDNELAIYLAQLEHFDSLFLKYKNKQYALKQFCERKGIELEEVAYIYGDSYDFAIAKNCGVRVLINKKASPLSQQYAIKKGYCDYLTGLSANTHALREISELFLGLLGNFEEVLEHRIAFDKEYQDYFSQRNMQMLELFRG